MRSGNGQTFKPNIEMVQNMVNMASDDLSRAVPPSNPALLKRVYNIGNPHFSKMSNGSPSDFSNFRWSLPIVTQTSHEVFGWTLIKVIEFNEKPELFDGTDIGGQYIALSSISNLSQYIGMSSNRNMADNRCAKVAAMMINKTPTGAKHLSNEMIWFHNEEVSGFPCPNLETGCKLESQFDTIQRTIFNKCTACHSGPGAPHGLDLSTANLAFYNLVNRLSHERPPVKLVSPGEADPKKSYLVAKIIETNIHRVGARMPPQAPHLSINEIDLITSWIIDGATR